MSDSPPPSRPAGRADLAGTLLAGRYRFERLIATGGMAQVWEATDLVLDRRVAVKLLHAHLTDDTTCVERFRRESIAAARLAHPSIVSIFDTYSGEGMEAIVMELVDGITLRQELDRRHSLPPDEAVRVGVAVADALAVAHQSRLVHRDIKPANILLCQDERVMVADFGIAKLDEGGDHTKEGTMLGTAKYLAPEQVEGRPVDARTDVYALGIVLYEMLCGRPPFDADTDAATALARLTTNPPRPRQIKADLPRELDDVVMRAMARDPDQRFAGAAELRAALQAADLGPSEPLSYADNTAVTTRTPPAGTPAVTAGSAAGAADVAAKGASAGAGAPPGGVKRERGMLFPALIVAFVAIALAVAGVLIGNTLADGGLLGGSDATTSTTQAPADPAPVTITTATPFDPEVGDGENDEAAPRAFDDDPTSAWVTSTYNSSDFGGLKEGVGLILTLDQTVPLDTLTVSSSTGGWTADVYVGEDAAPDLAGWGEPTVAAQPFAEGETVVDLGGATGDQVLIWITGLPDGGNVAIADVSVASS